MRRPWRRARPVRANGGRRAQGHEPGSWPPAPPAGVRRTGPPARAMASAAQEGRPVQHEPCAQHRQRKVVRRQVGKVVQAAAFFFCPAPPTALHPTGAQGSGAGGPWPRPARADGGRRAQGQLVPTTPAGRTARRKYRPQTIVVGQTLALDGMMARAARAVAGSAADQQRVLEDLRSLRSAAVSSGIE